jgi:hypothetical protein
MTDNQVSIVADQYLDPTRWNQMKALAESLVQSKAFPKAIQNASQALVVMQAGIEMGMKPIEAINSLSIINGVIGTWGKATTNRLREHGWRISYKMLNERGGGCEATVTKGDESYTDSLYFESAEKSGWTKYNGNLKASWAPGANREMKLRYGVLSKIIKTYIPEVLGNAVDIIEVAEDYVIDEIQAEQINVGARPKTDTVMVATPEERTSSLKDFIAKEQNKPKTDVKTPKIAEKVQKDSNSDKKGVEIVPEPQKPQAEEGEIIAATATKEK